MRYDENDRESSNVEDRRGQRGGFGFPFPGRRGGSRPIRIPIGGRGGLSITSLIIIGVILMALGINPLDILRGGLGGGIPGGPGGQIAERRLPPQQSEKLVKFTKRVLADTEDVWRAEFQRNNGVYREPKLVLFRGATGTACGLGQSAMGPFYCPADQKIYIDLSFFEQLKRRFKAPGDFAQAYVIAHEVGHHVQTLLGIAAKVQQMKRQYPGQKNSIQVRMELQADCLSGVWAKKTHQIKNRLEPGDIEEGLNAANAIGDDMIQRRTRGHVVPDSFTHGTSAQRVRWFKKGFDTGEMSVCNGTFSGPASAL